MKNKNTSFILQMAAMFVAVIMTVLSVFGIGYSLGLFNYDDGSAAENFDNLVIGEGKSNGISLTSTALTGDFDNYNSLGYAAIEAYSIKASYNSDSTYQGVIYWKVDWAIDNELVVTDYVNTAEITSENGEDMIIYCYAGFDTQIIITAYTPYGGEASCTCDYISRLSGITLTLYEGDNYVVFDSTYDGYRTWTYWGYDSQAKNSKSYRLYYTAGTLGQNEIYNLDSIYWYATSDTAKAFGVDNSDSAYEWEGYQGCMCDVFECVCGINPDYITQEEYDLLYSLYESETCFLTAVINLTGETYGLEATFRVSVILNPTALYTENIVSLEETAVVF